MTDKQQLNALKFLAVATAAWYLYHKAKSQGQSLEGRINIDQIAGLGASLLPAEYRGRAKHYGSKIIKNLIERGN